MRVRVHAYVRVVWLCDSDLVLSSVEKIKVLLDAITAIYQQFKKDKAERRESHTHTNCCVKSADRK